MNVILILAEYKLYCGFSEKMCCT